LLGGEYFFDLKMNFDISSFERYLKNIIGAANNEKIEVHHGTFSTSPMVNLIKFRDAQYQTRNLFHLLSNQPDLTEDEWKTDHRSLHFWATHNDEIIASMRATPSPYEISLYNLEIPLDKLKLLNRLEFSRLIGIQIKDLRVVTQSLIACACLIGVEAGFDGVVAMCRAPQRRLFEKFGLTAISAPIFVPKRRNAKYWLMNATWAEIATHMKISNAHA
jgi:hypothetical protein